MSYDPQAMDWAFVGLSSLEPPVTGVTPAPNLDRALTRTVKYWILSDDPPLTVTAAYYMFPLGR